MSFLRIGDMMELFIGCAAFCGVVCYIGSVGSFG